MSAYWSPLRLFAPATARRTTTFTTNNRRFIHTMSDTPAKVLSHDSINAQVRVAKYAVRGELVIRSMAHEKTLAKKDGSLPFKEIIYCNIGNPQQLGQQPLTFFRQVVAACEYPPLTTEKLLPSDARARAKEVLDSIGSTGAYSQSAGIGIVLKDVADFIQRRDGHPSDINDIFLTDGASVGVQRIIRLLIRDEKDGIMIPIPQYPLYSATIELYAGSQVGYYLNEDKGWGMEVAELERAYDASVAKGVTPRAVVVINPGNPTGQALDRKNMEEVIDFCLRKNVMLMADEVYQENVYVDNKPFVSFKKVLSEMPAKYKHLELASFHSVSKGFVGECGKRGGYMELVNFSPEVKAEVYKLASIGLCPNVVGQLMVDLMVRPPKEGDESYAVYKKERDAIFGSLKRRALLLNEALNKLEGVKCNTLEGAMYAFPKITIPPKAVEAAKAKNMQPDVFYCVSLLDATGICVVPGSGFGQRDGTWHFRTTFLPMEDKIQSVCNLMAGFHKKFMDTYR